MPLIFLFRIIWSFLGAALVLVSIVLALAATRLYWLYHGIELVVVGPRDILIAWLATLLACTFMAIAGYDVAKQNFSIRIEKG